MKRAKSFLCLFFLLVAAASLLAGGAATGPGQQAATVPKHKYHAAPSSDPLPPVQDPKQFEGDHNVYVAYALASQLEQLLYQMPCVCGCDRERGHDSLLDCFVGTHGSRCRICQREAIFCFLQQKKGKSPAQIRDAVERGKATKLDLKKYAERLYPQLEESRKMITVTERNQRKIRFQAESSSPRIPNRKEVISMKYEKPELFVLPNAIHAIEHSLLKTGDETDSICHGGDTRPSTCAYQSDE